MFPRSLRIALYPTITEWHELNRGRLYEIDAIIEKPEERLFEFFKRTGPQTAVYRER